MSLLSLTPAAQAIVRALRDAGGRPLLVGGLVRDALLGRPEGKDLDIEVFGLGIDALVETLSGQGKVHQVGRSFGVLKMQLEDGSDLDVSLPRRESKEGRGHKGFLVEPDPTMSLREAALRRDFTCNAMAWDPASEELIDHFGGCKDLEDRVLRATSERFAEDPLRVLRGMQLAGRFAMRAEPGTLDLCRRLASEAETLATERVWGEWHKWAGRATAPAYGLELLRDAGWRALYPELEALEECPQDPEWHPEGDVWTHTQLVCDAAAEVAERDALPGDERAVLMLAALCHDLGKPETTFEDEEGRIRSPMHAEKLDTIEAFLMRIGAPEKVRRRVLALSRHHLAYLGFSGSKRHVRRLARALGDEGETLAMLGRLAEADHGGRPPLPGGLPPAMVSMLEVAKEIAADESAPKPILMGRHLIDAGVAPGPAMGEILEEAFEAQLDGAFGDLAGALDWMRARLGL